MSPNETILTREIIFSIAHHWEQMLKHGNSVYVSYDEFTLPTLFVWGMNHFVGGFGGSEMTIYLLYIANANNSLLVLILIYPPLVLNVAIVV